MFLRALGKCHPVVGARSPLDRQPVIDVSLVEKFGTLLGAKQNWPSSFHANPIDAPHKKDNPMTKLFSMYQAKSIVTSHQTANLRLMRKSSIQVSRFAGRRQVAV